MGVGGLSNTPRGSPAWPCNQTKGSSVRKSSYTVCKKNTTGRSQARELWNLFGT